MSGCGRRQCDRNEVCVAESVVSACFEDLGARDAELRDMRVLIAKAMVCVAESEHYAYLLHVRDRPACAECVRWQTCFAIEFDHACRPDCLREPP